MVDWNELSRETDTSVAILQAIADQLGDDEARIRDTLDSPSDFDAIITRARELLDDSDDELRWQGRAIG